MRCRTPVSSPELYCQAGPSAEKDSIFSASGLEIGGTIRVIREPYFGKLGKVVELPPELRTLETEAKVRVLEVQFDDGTRAVLPRANVEMIEG